MAGYRSVRSVGQRYRIIYKIFEGKVIVAVVALGISKEGNKVDVYTQVQKLLNQGLLKPEEEGKPE